MDAARAGRPRRQVVCPRDRPGRREVHQGRRRALRARVVSQMTPVHMGLILALAALAAAGCSSSNAPSATPPAPAPAATPTAAALAPAAYLIRRSTALRLAEGDAFAT